MKTAGRRTLLVGALALLVGGCNAAEVTAVPEAVPGPTANQASYAYSTPYGDMWDVEGEAVPAGYGAPWPAVVGDRSSKITFAGDCEDFCDVHFTAWMNGLWHNTRQTITWAITRDTTLSGTSPKENFGWSCAVRVSLLNCMLAERTDVHTVRLSACGWSGTMSTNHEAWWGSWFDISLGDWKVGKVGLESEGSIAPNLNVNLCLPPSPGSGNGGSPGQSQCYEFYLAWYDGKYYHLEYLYTRCFGVGGDAT